MLVRVMPVWSMRMAVRQAVMPVPMRVRLSRRGKRAMSMLMVRIVHMGVDMVHFLMRMLMIVHLRDVQPHAQKHESACGQ